MESSMKNGGRIRCAFLMLLLFCATASTLAKSKKYVLYVGTYTDSGSKGIYAYEYDAASGKASPLGVAAETSNPSFLAVDARRKFLYTVNETHDYKGAASGSVTAFAIDPKTHRLRELNEVASRGADPCYISLDKSGNYVLVANYNGGNVAAFPLAADGHIGEASSVIQDQGAVGPNKERQEKPHAHWIETSARNRFAYVSDLGLDRVLIYKFDADKGALTRDGSSASPGGKDFFSATLAPGTGPRHVAFSSDGQFMYVLGELDSTVTVFANDAKETYKSVQKISALPSGFSGKNDAAEIAMHPTGKFLYTSNRGDDSIAVFTIDTGTGQLTFVERVPGGGKTPRNFAVDPSGAHLLVANQESGNIVAFQIDAQTGKLSGGSEVARVPSPVCLVFVQE
ncbi:MAG: 6-phosphogluconolactonase [Acidobacteria bacterium]|nr:MAG: 6-phosphogluconolactonase [Acidobacteriota bacterium]